MSTATQNPNATYTPSNENAELYLKDAIHSVAANLGLGANAAQMRR